MPARYYAGSRDILLVILLALHLIDIVAHLLMLALAFVVDDSSRHEEKSHEQLDRHIDIVGPRGYLRHLHAESAEEKLVLDVQEEADVPNYQRQGNREEQSELESYKKHGLYYFLLQATIFLKTWLGSKLLS